jgi:erythronate-4-phosphate dehydrogenase
MVDLSTPHIAGYSLDGKVGGTIMIYNAVWDYFGLKAQESIEDFLPAPEVPEIRIESQDDKEQEIIRQTVQQVYVINRDDFNTREIAMVPQEQRGRFFDDLRKNYSVRREFQNTTVLVEDKNGSLAEKLEGIGFLLSQD